MYIYTYNEIKEFQKDYYNSLSDSERHYKYMNNDIIFADHILSEIDKSEKICFTKMEHSLEFGGDYLIKFDTKKVIRDYKLHSLIGSEMSRRTKILTSELDDILKCVTHNGELPNH
jgi:hypothetical protein